MVALWTVLAVAASVLASCSAGSGPSVRADGRVLIVAAENQYGDVAAQVGGAYAVVSSVVSNPNTDPHTYELSPQVAGAIRSASVVIQNGLGYDSFMDTVERSAGGHRYVIVAQKVLALRSSTPNPHLWYDPRTMPAVAWTLARDLGELEPAHAAYFRQNAARFVASLQPWTAALAAFRKRHPGVPVATTEPVADYLLDAAGAANRTPWSFQSALMNGVDPAPQDVTLVTGLIRGRRVRALVYNQQVTDSVTAGFVQAAERAGVPVVGVYETMPVPGYDYQHWMVAEVHALDRAITTGMPSARL